MSFWAIQSKLNPDHFYDFASGMFSLPQGNGEFSVAEKSDADEASDGCGGTVVELVEKPAPVVVSQEEAKILSIKDTSKLLREIDVYANFLDTCGKPHPETVMRLMRAYVNEWTVDKPKQFVLPMPSSGNPDETVVPMFYAYLSDGKHWYQTTESYVLETVLRYRGAIVTQADIDAAPDWVKAIKPVEVHANDDF